MRLIRRNAGNLPGDKSGMSRSMNIEKNIVETVYSMRLKAREGKSIEQILVDVSKEKHGLISTIFSEIIEKVNAGESFEKVVDELYWKEKVENMKKLLKGIKDGYRSEDRFDEILRNFMEDFMKHKKVDINQYSENVDVILNLIILFMIVPFFMQTITIFASIGEEFIGNLDHIVEMGNMYLIVNTVIIAMLVAIVKRKEPVI